MKHEIVILSVLVLSCSCYEILSPDSIAGHYEGYGVFWGKSPHKFNITGKIVLGNPADGCSEFKNKDEIEGNIVLIDKDNCYPQEKMIHAHKAGASAAMLSAYDLQGQLNYIYDGRKHNSLNIATVEVSISAYKDLKKPLKNGENVTVVLYPSDNNPFDELFSAKVWIPWMVLFIPWQSTLFITAAVKYSRFVQVYGFEKSITQTCLILIMISRIPVLLWCFDPNTYFQIYPDWLSTNLGTAYAPFAVGAYLLLAFYWQELSSGVKGFNNVIPKLERMKIPFIILFCLILGMEMAGWVPRALNLDTETLTLILVVIIAVTLISATIFYFVQAWKILRVFRQSVKISNKGSNLKRVTTLILLTGGCWLISALVTAGLGLNLSSPKMIIAIYWIPYTMATLACTCIVLIFTPPKRGEGSSSDISMQPTMKHSTDVTITTSTSANADDRNSIVV